MIEVIFCQVAAQHRQQRIRITLTVLAVFQMVGHFDTVLRHNQLVDFFPLPQFFFQQLTVLIGVGNISRHFSTP